MTTEATDGRGDEAPATYPASVVARDYRGHPSQIEVAGLVFSRVEDQAEQRRITRQLRIGRRLDELSGTEARDLLREYDTLHGDALVDAERRVLKIVGNVLTGAMQGTLWALIYSRVMESDAYAPGDEMAFLVPEDLREGLTS